MFKQFIEENVGDMVFIRNSFRRYIYLALFFLLINYALVAFLYVNLLTERKPQTFATTSDGRIVNIYPDK
jgi:hypothetical protein